MGQVDDASLERMMAGVELEDGPARFTDITRMKNKKEEAINQWFYCTLVEGRNREVRRLWESQGYKVSRLKRVRFGPVHLTSRVAEGQLQELTPSEVAELYSSLGLPYRPAVTASTAKAARRRAPPRTPKPRRI